MKGGYVTDTPRLYTLLTDQHHHHHHHVMNDVIDPG